MDFKCIMIFFVLEALEEIEEKEREESQRKRRQMLVQSGFGKRKCLIDHSRPPSPGESASAAKAHFWSKTKKKKTLTPDDVDESRVKAYTSFAKMCQSRMSKDNENELFIKFISQMMDSKPIEVQKKLRSEILRIVQDN